MPQHLPRLLLFLLLVSFATPQAAPAEDAPVLLLQTASGAYDLDGEDLLIVDEIAGTLTLRASPDETVRFEGRSLSSQRGLQEVALWRADADTLLLGPGAEVTEQGTLVDMAVPDGLDVEVLLVGGRVLVSAIGGDLLVEAEGARVQTRGLRGDGEFLLAGGVLSVDGVKGEFSVKGTDVTAEIQHLYEAAYLNMKQGRTTIAGAEGEVQIESEGTDVSLTRVAGLVRVEGNGGSLSLKNCTGGGVLEIEGTTLSMMNTKGDFSVHTDAMVEFALHEGPLRVVGYGAPIQGSQVAGPLFVENDSSTVDLKQLSGTTEVRGSEMKVTVDDCKGPLNVQVASSDIAINRTESEVVIDNDFGDIETTETKKTMKITSRGGNVNVTDHQGTMELRADGAEVRAGWTKFSRTDRMIVQNGSGDVYLDLPANGRCNLEIRAPFGRVDTDLPGIEVADDRKSVSGEYTGGRGRAPQVKKPSLQVTSGGGNVYIGTSSGKD